MSEQATARPWQMDTEPADSCVKSTLKEDLRKAGIPFVAILSKEPPWVLGQDVAIVPMYSPREAQANAALIVTAVNSHDLGIRLAEAVLAYRQPPYTGQLSELEKLALEFQAAAGVWEVKR